MLFGAEDLEAGSKCYKAVKHCAALPCSASCSLKARRAPALRGLMPLKVLLMAHEKGFEAVLLHKGLTELGLL